MQSRFMTKTEFAALCGVSGAAITKHGKAGRLVMRGASVDAQESLKAMHGHLDETKHQAALERLEEVRKRSPGPMFDLIDGGLADSPPASGEPSEPQSWRARRDMFAAKDAELAYYERIGVLVPAEEVEQAIGDVVATFWAEADRNIAIKAKEIASDLQLTAEQASRLKSMMIADNRRLRNSFAESCERTAKEYRAPASTEKGGR